MLVRPQPLIAIAVRATAAIHKTGLVQYRNDLTRSRGRGRPTVPLEVAENNWILAGIAFLDEALLEKSRGGTGDRGLG